MSAVSGLLAIVLLGGLGPATSDQEDAPIEYRVRFVGTAKALELQGELHASLRPIARQGGATVWAMDQEEVRGLLEFIRGDHFANLVQAPNLTCEAGETGYVRRDDADGRFDIGTQQSSSGVDETEKAPGCPAEAQRVRCGNRLTIKGRQTDQGVLAHLTIEETRVATVHKVTVGTHVEPVPIEGIPGFAHGERKETQVLVPEVIGRRVEGEWLVPDGKYLLVSLGTYTVAERGAKAAVHDQLVLIEAQPVVRDPNVSRVAGRLTEPE